MGYTKQLFEVNQVLTAEELNLMDNQIYANDIAIESLKTSKQDKLDSTNIKTINGESILGPGNIIIEGGNGTVTAITLNGNTFNPSDGVVDLGEIDSVEFAASAKKVENKLTINVDGKTTEFDGSSSKTINITTGTKSANTSLFDVSHPSISITQNSPTGTEIDSNNLEDTTGKSDWISLCEEKFIYKKLNPSLLYFVNIKMTPKTNVIKIIPVGSISDKSFTVTYETAKQRFVYELSLDLPTTPIDIITGAPGTDPFLDSKLFEFKALVLDGETVKTVDASLPLYFNA